jgi:hypothetical protein
MRLFVLLSCLTIGVAHSESTEEMLSACKALSEPTIAEHQVALPQNFETGQCWGAFATLRRVLNMAVPPSKQPVFGVCAPKDSNRTQHIAIFIEFARRNPQRLHEDFVLVAMEAMHGAFPCRAK